MCRCSVTCVVILWSAIAWAGQGEASVRFASLKGDIALGTTLDGVLTVEGVVGEVWCTQVWAHIVDLNAGVGGDRRGAIAVQPTIMRSPTTMYRLKGLDGCLPGVMWMTLVGHEITNDLIFHSTGVYNIAIAVAGGTSEAVRITVTDPVADEAIAWHGLSNDMYKAVLSRNEDYMSSEWTAITSFLRQYPRSTYSWQMARSIARVHNSHKRRGGAVPPWLQEEMCAITNVPSEPTIFRDLWNRGENRRHVDAALP